MRNIRKEKRFPARARVYISDFPDTAATLKDISVHGCSVHSKEFLAIVPEARYVIDITPEGETDFKKFELDIKSRWIRANKLYCESGFAILDQPENEALERYVDYLSKQDAPKESPVTKPL
jgi:hypothetical protein